MASLLDKMQSVIVRECFLVGASGGMCLRIHFVCQGLQLCWQFSRPVNIILGAIVSLKYRSGWNITPPSFASQNNVPSLPCALFPFVNPVGVIVVVYLSIRIHPTDSESVMPKCNPVCLFPNPPRREDVIRHPLRTTFFHIIIYIINVYLIGAGNP